MEVVMDTLREVGGDLLAVALAARSGRSATTAQAALLAEIKRTSKSVENKTRRNWHGLRRYTLDWQDDECVDGSSGFRAIDLGRTYRRTVVAVKEHQPDILALSALLTTTAPEQGKVINALKEAGLRSCVKIMVGGGAITSEFASQIGADGYGATAPEAVMLAEELLGK
jgi:hypothetical protein